MCSYAPSPEAKRIEAVILTMEEIYQRTKKAEIIVICPVCDDTLKCRRTSCYSARCSNSACNWGFFQTVRGVIIDQENEFFKSAPVIK